MDNRHFHEPAYNQSGIAAHEAGHAVFSLLLQGHHGYSAASIWPGSGTSWAGIASVLGPQPGDKFLPPFRSTPPREWRLYAGKGWAGLVVIWAGSAACRHFERLPLDADSIRDDDSAAVGDVAAAEEIAQHFWPPDQVEVILDRSAAIAGELVQQPAIWLAIRQVGEYLAILRTVHINEMEVLVRRHLPGPIRCPGMDWAVNLARR